MLTFGRRASVRVSHWTGYSVRSAAAGSIRSALSVGTMAAAIVGMTIVPMFNGRTERSSRSTLKGDPCRAHCGFHAHAADENRPGAISLTLSVIVQACR